MHPRKLYTNLSECKDSRERAAEALGFLRDASGAEAGYLLLWRSGELVLVASSQGQDMPPTILEKARAQWEREADTQPESDLTRTIEAATVIATPETPRWDGPRGERYEPRFLGIYRDSQWVPVGMAVLRVPQSGSLSPLRRAYFDALCNAFIDADDVSVS